MLEEVKKRVGARATKSPAEKALDQLQKAIQRLAEASWDEGGRGAPYPTRVRQGGSSGFRSMEPRNVDPRMVALLNARKLEAYAQDRVFVIRKALESMAEKGEP